MRGEGGGGQLKFDYTNGQPHRRCRYKFPKCLRSLPLYTPTLQQHTPGLESSEDHSWSPSSSSVVEEGPLLMVGVDVRLPSDGGGGGGGGRGGGGRRRGKGGGRGEEIICHFQTCS